MKCYKGFDKDLKCHGGFQYEIGKTFETDKADICEYGFHACENPMDVLGYFAPSDSRYCEVDLDANDQTHDDSKRVGKRIRIETEIGLSGLISAGVKFILDRVDWKNAKESNTGYRSAATNTGSAGVKFILDRVDWKNAKESNTGYRSAATNTGNRSAATNTGNWSAATNTGNRSAATNTGDRSAATNTGDRSAATNTGNWSAATNTGDQSAATNTGYRSAATVEGKESIAIVTGYKSKAKGSIGCWIVLAERDEDMHILGVQAVCVDGNTIKPDTFYMLSDGEIVETD